MSDVKELLTILDSIKTDKDTNLLSENLKEGVSCLGIQGSFEGSNVEEVNIFQQSNEPETKDGIWIKSNTKIENIVVDNNPILDPVWSSESIESFDNVNDNVCRGILINNKLYIIGTDAENAFSGNNNEIIICNIESNTIEKN